MGEKRKLAKDILQLLLLPGERKSNSVEADSKVALDYKTRLKRISSTRIKRASKGKLLGILTEYILIFYVYHIKQHTNINKQAEKQNNKLQTKVLTYDTITRIPETNSQVYDFSSFKIHKKMK